MEQHDVHVKLLFDIPSQHLTLKLNFRHWSENSSTKTSSARYVCVLFTWKNSARKTKIAERKKEMNALISLGESI